MNCNALNLMTLEMCLIRAKLRTGRLFSVLKITDEFKLRRIAEEVGIAVSDRDIKAVAIDILEVFFGDFGSRKKEISFLSRVPQKRKDIWNKLGMTPRGVDREIAEMMHRTHMGCDNDAPNTMIHPARTSLSDGWGGSMIGTELSDVIFGIPSPGLIKISGYNLL
jgi:anaerobic carbon-monoxide dehydrogenase catalytic subunit